MCTHFACCLNLISFMSPSFLPFLSLSLPASPAVVKFDNMHFLSDEAHHNTLQHAATHCNNLQHTATHRNTLQRTATHRNILQHTSTHCNTPRHSRTSVASSSNIRQLALSIGRVCMCAPTHFPLPRLSFTFSLTSLFLFLSLSFPLSLSREQ